MKLQMIVEGDGEVSALPILLRRLQATVDLYEVELGHPILGDSGKMFKEVGLRKYVSVAVRRPCDGLLILLDAEGTCPVQKMPELERWARAEAGPVPCRVVMPCQEYEAWFLSAMESLRGKRGIRQDATSHAEPEKPRGAKGHIQRQMERGRRYLETADQAALTASFDMAASYASCRSFRRLVSAFGALASEMGVPIDNWPPPLIAAR